MALALPRSVFFHIPKTGGVWVREAIARAGIPCVELQSRPGGRTHWHNRYDQVETGGKFSFTFVRHPLDWYASYWSYRMLSGWRDDDLLDRFLSPDFERFMWAVLRYEPGFLSCRYERFIGPAPGLLGFVGRTETLIRDLVQALRLAGEEFDEEKLLSTPRRNVSRLQPGYSPPLREAVLRSERVCLARFCYA